MQPSFNLFFFFFWTIGDPGWMYFKIIWVIQEASLFLLHSNICFTRYNFILSSLLWFSHILLKFCQCLSQFLPSILKQLRWEVERKVTEQNFNKGQTNIRWFVLYCEANYLNPPSLWAVYPSINGAFSLIPQWYSDLQSRRCLKLCWIIVNNNNIFKIMSN